MTAEDNLSMMTNTTSNWLPAGEWQNRAGFRLFCFPYAGGTASLYRGWAARLAAQAQVLPVELPGRGARLKEPPFVNLPPLVEVLAGVLAPLLDSPFALFGHSMGATIAFELARHLRRRGAPGPQALFVSGRRAPQVPDSDPLTYNLPTDEFIEELGKLNGTPKEVLTHTELMELTLPLLRADFQLTQTYEYIPETPLECPITAYCGLADVDVGREQMQPWEEQTSSGFALRMVPGDHFFLRSPSSVSILLGSLAQELTSIIARSQANGARLPGRGRRGVD
jgi:medium-chain acyl-[acyl-carrier-protein] hydrolase